MNEINECCILVTSYIPLVLTDNVEDSFIGKFTGCFMIGMILINFLVIFLVQDMQDTSN